MMQNIFLCFASLYTQERHIIETKKDTKKGAKLAAVIQRIINSDKSGVMFSENPYLKAMSNCCMSYFVGLFIVDC